MPCIGDFGYPHRGNSFRAWLNCHLIVLEFEEVVILWGDSRCHLHMIKPRTTPECSTMGKNLALVAFEATKV